MTKKVIAFGSFDILHPGHVIYLIKARALGDHLTVVVARDESIRKFKKREPVFGENDRLMVVSALETVDKAVLGNKLSVREDQYAILKRLRPDILAFGYDQNVNMKKLNIWLKANGLETRTVRLKTAYKPDSNKSSIIRKNLGL